MSNRYRKDTKTIELREENMRRDHHPEKNEVADGEMKCVHSYKETNVSYSGILLVHLLPIDTTGEAPVFNKPRCLH